MKRISLWYNHIHKMDSKTYKRMHDNEKGPWGHRSGEQTPKEPKTPKGMPPSPLQSLQPKLEDKAKKAKEDLHKWAQGKDTQFFIKLGVIGGFVLWILSGFYLVDTSEQGVILRFGKYVHTTGPGLHYHLPWPIERAYIPNVTEEKRIEIGFRSNAKNDEERQDQPKESMMLTGDPNIVKVNFTVTWVIKDASAYLFNIRDQESTIRIAAQSAMREIVGQTKLFDVLADKKREAEEQTRELLQQMLDSYQAGVEVRRLELLSVKPPEEVEDSFNEVERARQDQERQKNEAMAYRDSILPIARGEAEKIIKSAEAYKSAIVNEALGEAKRFEEVYKEYKKAPMVTKRRLYLETMERVLEGADKTIIDNAGKGAGVLPYLPLNELKRKEAQP